MTAIFYPDAVTRSPDWRFTLEARSPHNGSIPHRDGRPAASELQFEYRSHQKDFRYRLTDNRTGAVAWERWQPEREDSPRELVVSNDGWSVVRTHGFRQELVAIDPSGREAIRVEVEPPWRNPNRGPRWCATPTFAWVAGRMIDSTAGYEWAGDWWRYFVRLNGRPHFAWRCWWGDRGVIDLEAGELRAPTGKLAAVLDRAEAGGAARFLARTTARMDELRDRIAQLPEPDAGRPVEYDPLLEALQAVRAAAHLAGVHRVRECVTALRYWESIDLPGSSSSTTALGPNWWVETQTFRPVVHHALRRLGEAPVGFPTYHFRESDGPRLPIPQWVPHRPAALARITRTMSAAEVLQSAGSPDHVVRRSGWRGDAHAWVEAWEYDTLRDGEWTTLQLTWEDFSRQANRGRGRQLTPRQQAAEAELDGPVMTNLGPAPPGRAVSDERMEDVFYR